MAEIFLQGDIISLFENRFIVIIGDSIQRGVYKDVVLLLQRNKYLTDRDLRAKGEFTFSGDKLIEGGQYGEMSNGVKYREVRQYQTDHHLVRFYFVTRCYNGYVESILSDLSKEPLPDAILMNSCLWDISRYGVSSVNQYKKNLDTLFKRFSEVLPKSCLVLWNMTLPISKKARGGVLIPEVEHLNVSLRLDILEANFYVHKLALKYGYNTLDLHYYLRHQLQRRAGDGVHWDMTAHRRITNLILTHIAEAWGHKPPDHARKVLLKEQRMKQTTNRPRDFNGNFNFGLAKPVGYAVQEMEHRNVIVNNYGKNRLNDSRFSNLGQFDQAILAESGNNYGNNMLNDARFSNFGQFDQALLRESGHNMDIENQRNIDRYGGPIRFSNFAGVDVSNMVVPQNIELLNQPYLNEDFNTGAVRGHRVALDGPSGRAFPYRSHNPQVDRYSHAY